MRYEGQHPLASGEARGHASVNEASVNGVHPQTLEAQLIAEREAQQRKRDQAVLSMPLVGQPAAPGIDLAGYALPLEPVAPAGTGGYTQRERLTREAAHKADQERALQATIEERRNDIERSIKFSQKGPKVRLDKRGKILDSEQELYRRALKKQEHLRTYSEQSGLFGVDSHHERASQNETYRVMRLQKELKRLEESTVPQGSMVGFSSPHRPDEGPSFSSTTSPRKQRQSSKPQGGYSYGNVNSAMSLPMGAYDSTKGAGMGAGALLGDPLAGVNIVSEVFPLHPTRERGRVE